MTGALNVVTLESTATQPAEQLGPLVERMARGDADALERLYDRTIASVFAVAMALLENRADAEEVAEDVYVQAWHRSAQFDAQRGSVQAWLSTICRSRAIDALRSRRRRVALSEAVRAEPQPSGCEAEPLLIQHARLQEALAVLSVPQRQVLSLAYFQGFTHQEIATRLGLQLGTVKTHLRRALQALRTRLTL